MVMDITNGNLGLLPFYFMGGLVVVLFLLLVSFILNNKRASRIEAIMDELQERLVQSEVALADAGKSLDELFGKRRANGGELNIPTDLESLTFIDDEGNTHNLKETIESLKQQINDVGAEQQRYYQSIIQEQQVLVESVSSLKDLIANIQADRANNATGGNQANDNSASFNQVMPQTYADPQENAYLEAEQAFNQSANGIFMPPGAAANMMGSEQNNNDDLASDASFAQTAADIAQLVAKTDFSAIDPNSAPTTIGEHMQNAQRQAMPRPNQANMQNMRANRAPGHNQARNNPNHAPSHNAQSHGMQNNKAQGFVGGRDPMNPLGINKQVANNSFDPQATFGNGGSDLGSMSAKENPTPGLLPPEEQLIEYEIPSPSSEQIIKNEQSLSLDNNQETTSLVDAIDFNEVVVPNVNIDPNAIGDTAEVALGMDSLNSDSDSNLAQKLEHDGWQVAEIEPKAAFADQEIKGAIADKGAHEHHELNHSKSNSDEERFDALENFSKLYNHAVQDENSDKPNNLLESSFGSEQSVNQATSNTKLTIDYTSSDSLDSLDNLKVAVNHDMSPSVAKNNDAQSNLKGDMSAANVDYLKVPQNAPVVDMIYDHNYVQQQKDKRPNGISIDTLDKAKTFIEAGVSLTEISAKTGLSEDEIKLIYDVDENGKIKDTAAQFKKQAEDSEENILDTNVADDKDNNDSKNLSNKATSKKKGAKKNNKTSVKQSPAVQDNNPSSALDKDERMVIESMMQEKHDPFSQEVAKELTQEFDIQEDKSNSITVQSSDPIPAPVGEELSEEEALAASLLSREMLEEGKIPELSQEADFKAAVEQNKLEREQALAQSIEETQVAATLDNNLDAIDRLANSIISENEKNGLLSTKEHHSEPVSDIDDPLNVLGDFKHKKGSSVAALAQSIKNTSDDYMAELEHDINDALKDDSVTIGSSAAVKNKAPANKQSAQDNLTVEQRVQANRKKISSLASSKDNPSQAARAAMQAQKSRNSRKSKARDQGAIGAVGSATSERSYEGMDLGGTSFSQNATANRAPNRAQSQAVKANAANNDLAMRAALDKGPQSSGRGLSALLGADIDDDMTLEQLTAPRAIDKPIKSNNYPTVDEALAQIESTPRSAPLSLGAIEQRATLATSSFSSVSSKNPGMADVIAMAPMALGSIEGDVDGMVAGAMIEDEDPAALLSQVVKGGFNSVALSNDQLNTLNEINSNGIPSNSVATATAPQGKPQHYANYQARNAYGIKRR